ncbi:methyltransferase domain-containing protein [Desulfohalobiaceae bacterium Ax17]|uniref:class I SAM-dependent methyltransferase n=1 Tax=Desulfovulcanus ferrireducens TaxID=2831190 RepID=UPI00207BA883|nr:methyltransferase domain-containing protein [Desulfovulcanus ferrireducens]MBT8764132.1 methyltransferase domain-containing protein [Desulfovulcanus ferrireducens]
MNSELIKLNVARQKWLLKRPADLETLWTEMDELDQDERIPYWVEVWPASKLLGEWLIKNKQNIRGKLCLDLGCGLGLTSLIASKLQAKVIALDYAWQALYFGRQNSLLNDVCSPLWVQMDWRTPGFKEKSFDYILGSDVFYERRFFEPISTLFDRFLAPGGKIWLGDPERTVSKDVWTRLKSLGWQVRRVASKKVELENQKAMVNLWEVCRQTQ